MSPSPAAPITGSGRVVAGLQNNATGEVRVSGDEAMRFLAPRLIPRSRATTRIAEA